jgi:radical SAM superfamily enzyme YgiQ (UPF0313 family)
MAYFTPVPVLPVLFSRGCKWRKCRFCSHNFSFGSYRPKPHLRFVDELEYLHDAHGTSHFYFADQYIGPDDLDRICSAIRERGLKIFFHAMARPEAGYTARVLDAAYGGGCRWISWGIESGSQRLLDICGKGTCVREIEPALRDSHQAGISNLAMMIFGMPGTDDDCFNETLSFAARVSDCVDAFTASAFQLFAGTGFYSQRGKYGLHETGREVLLELDTVQIRSNRVFFTVAGERNEIVEPPHIAEIKKWEQWKWWVRGGTRFFEQLNSEHYLVHASSPAGN